MTYATGHDFKQHHNSECSWRCDRCAAWLSWEIGTPSMVIAGQAECGNTESWMDGPITGLKNGTVEVTTEQLEKIRALAAAEGAI